MDDPVRREEGETVWIFDVFNPELIPTSEAVDRKAENDRERVRQRIAFVLLRILAVTILAAFLAYGLEATRTL